MHVYLLGPIEIVHDGQPIPLSGRRQRALVAALASEVGKVVSTGRLIDALWGEQPPASARAKLQGCVSDVRKVLAHLTPETMRARWPLMTREPGYLLSAEGVVVDLLQYLSLLHLAGHELDAGEVAAASEHLGEALRLWRGPAYADARTPVLSAMAVAIEGGRLLAIERKAECDLRLGRYDMVINEGGLVLAAHQAREGMRAAVMLALYRSGCRAEALELYRMGRRLLREQLGIEPGPVLRRLHEFILCDDPQLVSPAVLDYLSGAAAVFPATRPDDGQSH